MELSRVHRHRYIIEDPARLGCLLAAAGLLFVQEVPFWMTMAVVAVTQLAPVMMAARALEQGWSRRWGMKVHSTLFASNLAMDFTTLSACTVAGALLLVRHFNGPEVVKPLAILTVAICFIPDARLCRFLLSGDPVESSRQLRHGPFLRDPVMMGVLLAVAAICMLDRTSLTYVLFSLVFLQFNSLLVLADKYLPEIETRFAAGWKTVLLEREGRRLMLTFSSLALVPLRLALGDRMGWSLAGVVAAAVVLPDVWRLTVSAFQGVSNLFKMTPAPAPATYIVLPK